MNRRNFQKEMEDVISANARAGRIPRLLLHSCCAPCSSYSLEMLTEHFLVTDFYYNPNITRREEYEKREEELARLIAAQPHRHPVTFLRGKYDPESFFALAKGLESCPEGGERCFRCYELRLREAAKVAAEGAFDYFTTTLTISPFKNAQRLNEIGERLAAEFAVAWLPTDLKKKGGYQRSIELSRDYDLYRQDYCGCIYSEAEARRRREERMEK